MSDEFCFLRIQKDRIPTDQVDAFYAQGLILDLDGDLLRHLFMLREAKDRGFFIDNNFSQVSDGKSQLPLLTWSFLDYLSTRKLDGQRLVELGSGNSTLWFSKKFQSVKSYETDPRWSYEISKALPSNATVNLVDIQALQSAEIDLMHTDWLLIDFAGMRTQFIDAMLKKGIKPAQVILDNADWYRNGATLLIEAGYTEIPFFGFKSGQTWISCTSIFLMGLPNSLKEGTFIVPQNARVMKNGWDQL